MDEPRKAPTERGSQLEEMYDKFFSGQPAPTWKTTDANGNFVMPSLYQPARLSYSSRVG